MAATHLPASQVCAPCPPPVDAAPVRHGGHNCRLLRGKKKTVSLLWQKKRKKEVLLTKKKKVVSADFFSGIKEKSSSSINYDTVSEARKIKFCLSGLEFLTNKSSQFTLVVALQRI